MEYFVPDYYELEMAYMMVQRNQNGQTYASMGKLTPNKDGSYTIRGMYATKPTATRVDYTISQKDGKLNQIINWYAADGKKTQSYELNWHRVMTTGAIAF